MTDPQRPGWHSGGPDDSGQPQQRADYDLTQPQPVDYGQYPDQASPEGYHQAQAGRQSPSVSAFVTSKTPMELLPYMLFGLAGVTVVVSLLQLAGSDGSRWVNVLFYLLLALACGGTGALALWKHRLTQPITLVVSGAVVFFGLSVIGLVFGLVFTIGGERTNAADWISFLLAMIAIAGAGLIIAQLVFKDTSNQQPLSSMLRSPAAPQYAPPPQQPPDPHSPFQSPPPGHG